MRRAIGARCHALAHPERFVRRRGRPVHASEKGKGPGGARLTVTEAQVSWLEGEIDRLNAELAPLNSFILPGGSPAAAYLHLARTVCRRAERIMVELNDKPGETVTAGRAQIRQPPVRFPVRRQPRSMNDKGAPTCCGCRGRTAKDGPHVHPALRLQSAAAAASADRHLVPDRAERPDLSSRARHRSSSPTGRSRSSA